MKETERTLVPQLMLAGIQQGVMHECPSIYLQTSETTNVAYRIATFLHIMKGSNELSFLSRYSSHIVQNSDNMEQLRGAYGPRMRNWIGAHQLQEMINMNADLNPDDADAEEVDVAEDGTSVMEAPGYTKPVGIDQTLAVFDDLQCGMNETTIVIRDPGVDFEESEDIPDLISITFINDVNTLRVIAQYGTGNNPNWHNEIWALHLLAQMYSGLLEYDKYVFCVNCYAWEESGPYAIAKHVDCEPPMTYICDGVKGTFWADLEILQLFAQHIQCYLNEKTFDNPDVSNEWCNERLHTVFIDKMQNEFFKDMAYALAIWAFWTYGDANPTYAGDYETQIAEMFGQMHPTSIRLEVAEFLSHCSLPFELTEAVKELYHE